MWVPESSRRGPIPLQPVDKVPAGYVRPRLRSDYFNGLLTAAKAPPDLAGISGTDGERRTIGTICRHESSTFFIAYLAPSTFPVVRDWFSDSNCPIPAKPRPKKKASHRKNDGSPRNGMVGHTGFEPVTSGSGDQRSIQTELMPPGLMKSIRPSCGDLFCGASCACESRSCDAFVFFRRASNAPPCRAIDVAARVQPACSPVRPARSSREGLNTGAGRSGILTTSPVLGFRPIRGARVTTLNVPNPRISMCSPCFNAATTESRKPSTTAAVSDFGNPVASAI